MNQLAKLAQPFPARYVHKPPKGKYGSYVEHSTVAQALLATVGPFDLHVVQVIRGYVPERKRTKDGQEVVDEALTDAVVAIIGRLTVDIDGRQTHIEEVGDCEDPHNWGNDGARLKDAVSDFIKRAAARIGLGLHLWAQDEYFLDKSLEAKSNDDEEGAKDAEGQERAL